MMLIRVIVFYGLTFFFTMALGGTQEATGFSARLIILPQLAPAIAAVLMLLIFRRDQVRLNFSFSELGSVRTLGTALIPLAAAGVVYLIASARGLDAHLPAELPISIPGLLLGAVGEEVGWRGYLHQHLDRRLAGLVSSLVVGVLWALWHVGLWHNGAIYMLLLMVMLTSCSIVIYYLVAPLRFNIWIAALFHLAINVGNLLYYDLIEDMSLMMINAFTWAVIAGMLIALRSSAFRRVGAQAQEAQSPA
jgi:uncharacterized protein